MAEHWTAEPSSYRMSPDEMPIALVYNPTPGGEKNIDGTTSFGLRMPALILTEWVADPEETAADIARKLNSHADLVAALPELKHVISWLEGGCDVAKAVLELRIYEARIDMAKAALKPAEGK